MTVPVFSCQAANCSILCRSSSERPVAETAAGPVDSERSSVSRTQFSGAYIGDQLTVVDEVARSVTAQRLVEERRDLEHDALPHRKPV